MERRRGSGSWITPIAVNPDVRSLGDALGFLFAGVVVAVSGFALMELFL